MFLLISIAAVSGQDASEDENDGNDYDKTNEEGTCTGLKQYLGRRNAVGTVNQGSESWMELSVWCLAIQIILPASQLNS